MNSKQQPFVPGNFANLIPSTQNVGAYPASYSAARPSPRRDNDLVVGSEASVNRKASTHKPTDEAGSFQNFRAHARRSRSNPIHLHSLK
jgi:hypothetical protein